MCLLPLSKNRPWQEHDPSRNTQAPPMCLLRPVGASMCLLRWFDAVPPSISHKLTCIYMYVYVYIHVYMCMFCLHTHMCVYVYVYTHIY